MGRAGWRQSSYVAAMGRAGNSKHTPNLQGHPASSAYLSIYEMEIQFLQCEFDVKNFILITPIYLYAIIFWINDQEKIYLFFIFYFPLLS